MNRPGVPLSRFPWLWGLLGGALIALLAAWAWPEPSQQTAQREALKRSHDEAPAHLSSQARPATAGSADAGAALEAVVREAQRTPQQWQDWLEQSSSLRGAHLDGSWGVRDENGLVPDVALRRRFDQLLTLQGELSLTQLRDLLLGLAQRDLGPDADAVMSLWDRYVALVQQPLSAAVDLSQPAQWLLLLQEQQALRHQALGPEWAAAFFAEEEQALREQAQRLLQGQALDPADEPARLMAPAPEDVSSEQWQALRQSQWGEAAAQRLAQLDAQEHQWQSRLAQARAARAELWRQANLSVLQREAAWQEWVNAEFAPEQVQRVRALVESEPPS